MTEYEMSKVEMTASKWIAIGLVIFFFCYWAISSASLFSFLFSVPKYEIMTMKSPSFFYTEKGKDKSETGEPAKLYIHALGNLCSSSVDTVAQHEICKISSNIQRVDFSCGPVDKVMQRDICQVSKNIQKIERVEWVMYYYEHDGAVEASSNRILKQMNYLDKNGVAQTFILDDEQIQKNEYAGFIFSRGLLILMLITGCVSIILAIIKRQWARYPLAFSVFGIIGLIFYAAYVGRGYGTVPNWYLWLIQAA